jgi:ribosomal protein RSM22 (predicted rRNA methylase)
MTQQLQQAIEEEMSCFGLKDLAGAREELTGRYREREAKSKSHFMTTDQHRLSYIATRMPATYAAIFYVLQEIKRRMPHLQVKSLLDLGAGPGTGMWAACDVFPELEQVTLIEKDTALASLGKRLASSRTHAAFQKANWQSEDLEQIKSLPVHDLVLLSYSIGELAEEKQRLLLAACWEAAKSVLAVIEPGTPAGFGRIRMLRSQLIESGCQMVAPCPHRLACPMPPDDWCHFAQRVERSSMHRRLKGGSLGHEDEKFSYVAVAKEACVLPQARILRHPLRRSGHSIFMLCTAEGLKQETVSKRTPELYKKARDLEWGDSFPE